MSAQNLLGDLALEATQGQVRDTLNGVRTASGKALAVGNARSKFRDGFASQNAQPESDVWTLVNESPDDGTGIGHIINQGGDANGSSYLRISMSPFVDNSSVWLTSKQKFSMPSRIGWGISASQRFSGQELLFGLSEANDADPIGISRIQPLTSADVAISGAVVTTNVAVLTVPAGHPFRSGDRVIVVGCAETRLNVGPVYITAADATTISVPTTLGNGTYLHTGGGVRSADPLGRANNGFATLFEQANASQATLVGRRNGSKARTQRDVASGSSTAVSPAAWSDAFLTQTVYEQSLSMDECVYRTYPADSNSGVTAYAKLSQSIPDEELSYRLAVRARNLDDLSKPIARIISISKSGTTTATVTTDRPHGLTTTGRVGIQGVRDQANFPNVADVVIQTVPSATTFTVPLGATTVTVTDTMGGVVFLNHGGLNSPGATAFAIQNLTRGNGVLIVSLNASSTGNFAAGEYIHLWGMNGSNATGSGPATEGAYKILRTNGTLLELAAPGPAFTTFNTGGAIIRRTEYRMHFVRILDHTRHFVEVLGGRGGLNDNNNAVPVTVTSSSTVNVTLSSALPNLNELTETATLLVANGLYSGPTRDVGTDITRHPTRIKILVRHLAGIVPGSLYLEQSTDNINFIETWRVPIPSDGLGHTFEVPLHTRYFRWRFQNGATAQTSFLFQTRRTQTEGTVAEEVGKNLGGFHLTAVAGSAIAANTSLFLSNLDLGPNHKWNVARLLYKADVAGMGVAIEQSIDGVTWFWTDGRTAMTQPESGVLESKIAGRYVRARIFTGTTASTLTLASLSLASL